MSLNDSWEAPVSSGGLPLLSDPRHLEVAFVLGGHGLGHDGSPQQLRLCGADSASRIIELAAFIA